MGLLSKINEYLHKDRFEERPFTQRIIEESLNANPEDLREYLVRFNEVAPKSNYSIETPAYAITAALVKDCGYIKMQENPYHVPVEFTSREKTTYKSNN